MKKTIISLGSILLILFVVLTFLDREGRYAAEKDLYQLNRKYAAFVKDPEAAPDAQVNLILDGYQKFIDEYPDKNLTVIAHILRGRIYTTRSDYAAGRAEMRKLHEAFAGNERIEVQSLVETAQMYARERDKQGMLDTYQRLVKEHPLTSEGLQAPLIVARHFTEVKDTSMAARAYVDAIDHYKMLAEKYPDSQVEFRARVLLGTAYIALHDWKKSVDIFSDIVMRYANPDFWTKETFLQITRSINTIAVFELNDLEYPVRLYSSFMEKYPDHPFNAEFQKMISLMEEYKKYHNQTQEAIREAEGKAGSSSKGVGSPQLTDILDESTTDIKQVVPAVLPGTKVQTP